MPVSLSRGLSVEIIRTCGLERLKRSVMVSTSDVGGVRIISGISIFPRTGT